MDLVDNHFGWLIPIWLLKSSFLLLRYRRYTPCIPKESLRKGFPGLRQKEGPDLLERVPLGRSGWGLGGRILFRVDMCGSDNSKQGYGSDRQIGPKKEGPTSFVSCVLNVDSHSWSCTNSWWHWFIGSNMIRHVAVAFCSCSRLPRN